MQDDIATTPPPQLRVMQIIVVALAAGLGIFILVGLFKNQFAVQPVDKGLSLMAWIALFMLVPGIFIGLIVPRVMIKTALTKIAEGKSLMERAQVDSHEGRIAGSLLALRVTTLIIKLAAMEVPGYAAGVAYFVEKDVVGLAIAAGVTVFILLHFPTASGLQNWLDQRAEELATLV